MAAKSKSKSKRVAPARETLIARLFDSAQKQIDEITRRVEAGGRNGVQAEHDARATAALVKVLGGLASGDEKQKDADDDDDGPRDLDEFRRELARQMDEIVARRTPRDAASE